MNFLLLLNLVVRIFDLLLCLRLIVARLVFVSLGFNLSYTKFGLGRLGFQNDFWNLEVLILD